MERGSHRRDAPRNAGSLAGWGGTQPSAPSPTLGERRERKGWGSWEDPWSAITRRCTASTARETDKSHSGANAWVEAGGLGLRPLLPRDGGQPFASHLLSGEGKIRPARPSFRARAAQAPAQCEGAGLRCSRVRTRHLRSPSPPQISTPAQSGPTLAPRGVRPLASPPLVLAAARGLGVRRSLLHRPAPTLPCFLFNNIAREAPAESTRQNFLPDWGCGSERQSPVSWLPVPSGTGQRPRSRGATPSPAPPGILGHTWRSPGGGDSRTRMVG